jgi:hypothetical protein
MKFSLLIFSILFCSNAFANKLSIGLIGSLYSKKLIGENAVSGVSGEVVSNTNINYGLEFEYSISRSLRFLGSYKSRTVEFDNTDDVITGETIFNTSASSMGLKWILFSRTALRFIYNLEKDLGFKVVNDKAEIFVENSNYLTVFYDQIIFLGKSIYSGFRLGSDITSSGDRLSDRNATRYGVFITMNSGMGQLESFFEVKNIAKSSSSLDFTEKDSILHFTYRLIF